MEEKTVEWRTVESRESQFEKWEEDREEDWEEDKDEDEGDNWEEDEEEEEEEEKEKESNDGDGDGEGDGDENDRKILSVTSSIKDKFRWRNRLCSNICRTADGSNWLHCGYTYDKRNLVLCVED